MADKKRKHLRELRIDAASHSKLGNYSKAETTIKKALELDPSNNRLYHEMAKIHLSSIKIIEFQLWQLFFSELKLDLIKYLE